MTLPLLKFLSARLYSTKDRAMADDAEYRLMLWDGKGKRTISRSTTLSIYPGTSSRIRCANEHLSAPVTNQTKLSGTTRCFAVHIVAAQLELLGARFAAFVEGPRSRS